MTNIQSVIDERTESTYVKLALTGNYDEPNSRETFDIIACNCIASCSHLNYKMDEYIITDMIIGLFKEVIPSHQLIPTRTISEVCKSLERNRTLPYGTIYDLLCSLSRLNLINNNKRSIIYHTPVWILLNNYKVGIPKLKDDGSYETRSYINLCQNTLIRSMLASPYLEADYDILEIERRYKNFIKYLCSFESRGSAWINDVIKYMGEFSYVVMCCLLSRHCSIPELKVIAGSEKSRLILSYG